MKVSLFIYIDESSDHKNYILSAVGSNSPITLDNIVHRFRKVVRNSRLSDKAKSKINNDPKERELYSSFPEMLLKYLDLICFDFEKRQKPLRENVHICSAFYKKKDIERALHRSLAVKNYASKVQYSPYICSIHNVGPTVQALVFSPVCIETLIGEVHP